MLEAILSLVPYGIMFSIMVSFALNNAKLRIDLDKRMNENIMLCMEIERLRHLERLTKYQNSSRKNNFTASSDVIEAVKFAMTKAHPDNPGGSNERFIKYKELYDSLSK